jgi:hypothetical protein
MVVARAVHPNAKAASYTAASGDEAPPSTPAAYSGNSPGSTPFGDPCSCCELG